MRMTRQPCACETPPVLYFLTQEQLDHFAVFILHLPLTEVHDDYNALLMKIHDHQLIKLEPNFSEANN
ncbi:MAG TPA: hypothetical protein VH164_00325 [Ktedonobacteraceae bacterium]|nr:hypothetical protein [Ktedonobacteraceae bacterium]